MASTIFAMMSWWYKRKACLSSEFVSVSDISNHIPSMQTLEKQRKPKAANAQV